MPFQNDLQNRCSKFKLFLKNINVRPETFQFLEKEQNSNFDYKIVISVKNSKFIL